MAADLPQFKQKNAEVLALAVQDQASALAAAGTVQAAYQILADPDHRVADAYGVYNRLGDGLAAPAVFIINKSGQIAWSYIGQNVGDRPNNQTILENLPED